MNKCLLTKNDITPRNCNITTNKGNAIKCNQCFYQQTIQHETHIIHITKEHALDLLTTGTCTIEPIENTNQTFIITIRQHLKTIQDK